MASRELKVEIIGDASSLNKALGSVNKTSSKLGTSMKALGKVAAGAGLLIGAGFVATLKVGFEELAEGQKVMAQTEAVIKSTGGAANVSAKQMADYASSLSAVSGVDDEVIQSGENMLATFTNIRNETGKGNDIFKQATGTLLDMSTALGTDMNKSAIQLGKALNDPIKGITALQRVGVSFTEGQKETIKSMVETGNTMGAQKLILAELNKEFGGSAKAYGDTLPGALSKARNAFEEIAGHIAERFLPVLTKALNWVNSNWPQISKVVDQVADAIQNGLGQAAQTVQRNFDQIKAVAIAAFGGMKSAIEGVVRFLRTDFGQTVALGIGSVVALRSAMGTLGISIGGVGKALTALKTNPWWALMIPIGLAVGEITKKFIEDKVEAQNVAAAWDRATGSAQRLKSALDALKGTQLDVKQAQETVWQSTQRLIQTRDAYLASVAKEGQQSPKTIALLHDYNQAVIDSERAEAGLKDARAANQDQLGKLNQETVKAAQSILTVSEGSDRYNATLGKVYESTKFSADAAAGYAQKLRTLAPEQDKLAQKYRESSPAAADAAAKTADLALKLADLAEKQKAVPSRQQIIATAKLVGGPKFAADIQGIVSSVKTAADRAYTEGVNIGQNLGYGALTGIVRAKLAVIQAAIQMVIEAAAAARGAAESKSPSQLFARIGKDLVLGLAQGIGDNKEAKAKLKQLIGDPDILTRIGEASKTLGKTAVIEMIRGLVGLSPSFKAEAIKLIDDAMGGAKTEAATKAKEIAAAIASAKDAWRTAFGSLAQAGLDAIAAKYAGWQAPSALKAQAEAEAREKAALIKAVTDAQAELTAAIAAEAKAQTDAAVVTQKEGESDEDFAKRKADLVKAATDAGAAVAAAQKTVSDAEFAKRQSDLAALAKIETDKHNEKIKDEQDNWLKRLRVIMKEGGNVHAKVMALLKSFGIGYLMRGEEWGNALAQGLRNSIGEVEAAAAELAAAGQGKGGGGGGGGSASGRTGGRGGRARGGPVSRGFSYLVGERGPELFVPRSSGAIINARAFAKGGGKPPGTTSGKGGGGVDPWSPAWADPEIWTTALSISQRIGQFDQFMSAVNSGSYASNAGLLDGLFRNRTRWNWNDPIWSPRLMRMFEMMSGPEGLSGRQVADYFGLLKKGGTLPGDGFYYGHKGETVIPLNRSTGGVTVNFNGPVLGTEEQLTRKIIEGIRREQTRGAPSIIRGR